MILLTVEEIQSRISALDTQIAIATQADSYSLSSGMSSQSVKRQSITALLQLRDYWSKKLSEAVISESNSDSFRFVPMQGWKR